MSGAENKIIRRRLVNAYLSAVISISMVLLLVGLASMLLVNARSVSDYFKENLQITVLMKSDVSDEEAMDFERTLSQYDYIRATRFISKQQGAQELEAMLGEDFLSVFAASPIPASIEVSLKASYMSSDSLYVIKDDIMKSSLVDEVDYQQSLVEALNSNLSKISLVLGVLILLLLFISFVLIVNTVRLNVYARRFTIHTMKLVGATKSFIRAPFLLQAAFQGLFSAFLSLVYLLAIMFFLRSGFAQLFELFQMKQLLLVMGIVIVSGILICVLSTYLVIGKLVSLDKNELYY